MLSSQSVEKCFIKLEPNNIINIPFQSYDEFTFIVNGQKFKTTRIISDLLSPAVCKLHLSDPTINQFIITTQNKGDFNQILKLILFEPQYISESEQKFVAEIIQKLENKSIKFNFPEERIELTPKNVLSLLKKHEKTPLLYSNKIDHEIDYISSHFFDIFQEEEEQYNDLSELKIESIEKILKNQKLKLKEEDQLLTVINRLYLKDHKYSVLYEYVYFKNVSSSAIKKFISIYDINDINHSIWKNLSERLQQVIDSRTIENERYIENGVSFEYSSEKPFNGIINHLDKKDFKISSSNQRDNSPPENVILYDNQEKWFNSGSFKNSWICFDFLEHRVKLTDYIIKSKKGDKNKEHPKSWVIEGSNDDKNWEIFDERTKDSHLNGKNLVHKFTIKKQDLNPFRFIRMRQTETNWYGDDDLAIDSFEIFGKFI